eukprot:TRINITY_DN3269_c0_g1_i1.p1 TRINITY_DN3269_c0_g1~~TRINITY_DN3269_c0_g1_i1.p1  ORF type:complete len:278 (-),score=61.97 TRINITY_DN3269_c0_g1_i1:99-932(-)
MASNLKNLPFRYCNSSLGNLISHLPPIRSRINFLNFWRVRLYLRETIANEFSPIYENVLQAFVDKDVDFLQQTMESRLFQRSVDYLNELERSNQKLLLVKGKSAVTTETTTDEQKNLEIEEEAKRFEEEFTEFLKENKDFIGREVPQVFLSEDKKEMLLEAFGVYGVDINRDKNRPASTYKVLRNAGGSKDYFIDFSNLGELYRKNILGLNVYYMSNIRLIVQDSEGNIVEGNMTSEKKELHKWRFETFMPKEDWILTDMDDCLEGNPYIKDFSQNS